MSAARKSGNGPDLKGLPGGIGVNNNRKVIPPLSPRDRKILDRLLEGKTEKTVGLEFDLTQQRINEIKHSPAALGYMANWALNARTETYGMVIYVIRDRLKKAIEYGTDHIDWESLVKLVKVLEPKDSPDLSAYEFLHAEAERLADEMGMTDEARDKMLQFVRESA